MKIYHSGNHEGIGFAYALVPEWEKESKERTARDEKAQKEAQKERLRLLEPWEARIDETILAAGISCGLYFTESDTAPDACLPDL